MTHKAGQRVRVAHHRTDDFNPITFGLTRDACRDLDRRFRESVAD